MRRRARRSRRSARRSPPRMRSSGRSCRAGTRSRRCARTHTRTHAHTHTHTHTHLPPSAAAAVPTPRARAPLQAAGKADAAAKKLEHSIARARRESEAARETVDALRAQHPWIDSEKQCVGPPPPHAEQHGHTHALTQRACVRCARVRPRRFFGKAHTDYDFASRDPKDAAARLKVLEAQQAALGKKINKKARTRARAHTHTHARMHTRTTRTHAHTHAGRAGGQPAVCRQRVTSGGVCVCVCRAGCWHDRVRGARVP
jgi:hypothetical protein